MSDAFFGASRRHGICLDANDATKKTATKNARRREEDETIKGR